MKLALSVVPVHADCVRMRVYAQVFQYRMYVSVLAKLIQDVAVMCFVSLCPLFCNCCAILLQSDIIWRYS